MGGTTGPPTLAVLPVTGTPGFPCGKGTPPKGTPPKGKGTPPGAGKEDDCPVTGMVTGGGSEGGVGAPGLMMLAGIVVSVAALLQGGASQGAAAAVCIYIYMCVCMYMYRHGVCCGLVAGRCFA